MADPRLYPPCVGGAVWLFCCPEHSLNGFEKNECSLLDWRLFYLISGLSTFLMFPPGQYTIWLPWNQLGSLKCSIKLQPGQEECQVPHPCA